MPNSNSLTLYYILDPTINRILLTESGTYLQLPTQPNFFLSVPNSYRDLIWSSWVASRRKIKILMRGKKSSVYYWKGRFVGVSGLKTQLSLINWTFFPHIQILIFHREATQDDHIRSLYKFGTEIKNFGCVESCAYAPDSVKKNRQNLDLK